MTQLFAGYAFDPDLFDPETFLRDYWQKKPLLIRNPWKQWRNPIEPDELAGLSCESFVESRLIEQSADQYQLEHGPLPTERFNSLGQAPCTLLVQAVDHHIADVAQLLDPFRFIPNWRIDDIMVSYASAGGGVGAHYDQYDVFLIQGLGQRRWQLGAMCNDDTPLLEHEDLRLLAEFEPLQDWVLDPGDILYVPPRLAHKGVALGDDCMTYSVGFRAPSRSELIEGWAGEALDQLRQDDRYEDADLTRQDNPGEIPAHALAQLQQMAVESLSDPAAFARWFGQYATAPKNPNIEWGPETPFNGEEMERLLASTADLTGGQMMMRNPASRFAYVAGSADAITVMIDGKAYDLDGYAADFGRQLCAKARVYASADMLAQQQVKSLLLDCLNHGSIAIEGALEEPIERAGEFDAGLEVGDQA